MEIELFQTDTPIPSAVGSLWDLRARIYVEQLPEGLVRIFPAPTGYTAGDLVDLVGFEGAPLNEWVEVSSSFISTSETNTFSLICDCTSTSQLIMRVDDLVFVGPIETLSNPKSIEVQTICQGGVSLTWVNSLGGREYYTFERISRYEYGASNRGIIRNNLYQDYPDSFEEARAIDEQVRVTPSETWTLASGSVSQEDAKWLASIVYSPRVEWIRSDGERFVVNVKGDSLSVDTAKQGMVTLSVDIAVPQTLVYQP